MLITPTKQLNNVFERIVKDKNGILVRVRFIVVEVDGKFQGQIISAEPLVSRAESKPCASLPKPCEKTCVTFEYKPAAIKSGYYFNPLFFFNSQPTRAPSF
jgi:hypothetical protein